MVFRYLKRIWDKAPGSLRKLLAITFIGFAGALLITFVMMLNGLLSQGPQGQTFRVGAGCFVMVALFLGAFLLLLRVRLTLEARGEDPPKALLAMAFFGILGLAVPLLMALQPDREASDPSGMSMAPLILLPLLLTVPLIVYLVRLERPSQRPKARTWQLVLLGLGVFQLISAVMLACGASPGAEAAYRINGLFSALIGIALTLPYFLRK